jgi:hypothetical protein
MNYHSPRNPAHEAHAMTCYDYKLIPLVEFLSNPKVPDGFRWVRSENGYAVLERAFEDSLNDQITIYDGGGGGRAPEKAPKGATPPILPTPGESG